MKLLNRSWRPYMDLLESRRLFSALTPGLSVTASLTTASEVDSYTIDMKAGQTLVVALGETATTPFNPQVQLRDPSGAVVRTDTNPVGLTYAVTAASTGTYQLLVSDAGLSHTGAYQLTAFTPGTNFSYGEEGAEAESGRRRAAGIGPGDLDVWTITTNAGQFISAEVAENTPGDSVQVGLMLFAPDGTLVANKSDPAGVSIDVQHAQTQTGTYFVVVYEPTGGPAGRYGITFARLPGKQATEDPDTNVPLPNGVTRDGMLPSGDYDIFNDPGIRRLDHQRNRDPH